MFYILLTLAYYLVLRFVMVVLRFVHKMFDSLPFKMGI